MADGIVATQAAPTPALAKPLPNSLAQPAGAGWDPTAIEALNKLNWQNENKLAGDKETLTELGSTYNRSLEQQGETEATGFKALRSRNFASGLENSGFALGNREELAGRYTTQRGAKGEREQFKLNRLGAKVQQQEGEARYGAANIGNQNTARKEKKAREEALEAKQNPPPTPPPTFPAATAAAAGTKGEGGVQGYPKATAYINSVFPGGQGEQIAFSKMSPAEKKAWENVHGRARGGAVKAGGAYIVGERGPELMVPKVPGRVVPNNRLAAIRKALRGRR